MLVENKKYKCPKCKELKDFNEVYIKKSGRQKGQISSYCKNCKREYDKLWNAKNPGRRLNLAHINGRFRPMSEAKDCGAYLGVVVAEKALSKFFDNITRMPYGNPGFDFLCGKGFKIDVKSSCLLKGKYLHWKFHIEKNRIADYFLFLAFNEDRNNLEPQHVWLIPGDIVNIQFDVTISNKEKSLSKWSKYEKPLDKVIACCNQMREEGIGNE